MSPALNVAWLRWRRVTHVLNCMGTLDPSTGLWDRSYTLAWHARLLTSSTLIGASTTRLPVKTILMSFLDWKGFGCWDLAGNRNFPGIGAPPLTHSSGTTVDHICLQSSMEFLKLDGAFVGFTPLSDHLPVGFLYAL